MEKLIVVITTYNLEKYISEALDSVLRQKTNFHFKILIGDDASTDKTLDILNEYVEKFPDIIDLRLSQTNLGSLCNSNRLFDGLNCEYFTFLDGDDYWEDEYRLQKQIDFLDSHPDYMMCAGNTQYIKNGIKSDFLLTEKELGRTYTFEDYINQNMPFFHVSSIVIRNKIYINGLPECYKLAENTFENCALRGEDFRRISHLELGPLYAMPDLFSYYRIHDAGMWQGSSELKRKLEGAIEYNFLRKYYKDTEFFNFFNSYFSYLYKQLMKYLVLEQDIVNKYDLNIKNNYLLTSLLTDIAEQKIPLQTTYYTNLIENDDTNISLKKAIRCKLKKIKMLERLF